MARRGSHALPKPAIVRGVALKGEVWVFRSLLELGVGSAPPESHGPRGAVPGGKPGCCSHSWGAPTPGRQNRRALATSFVKELLHVSVPCMRTSLPKRPPPGPPGKFLPPPSFKVV